MWTGVWPAESVINGLPSPTGSPHNSQRSVGIGCCSVLVKLLLGGGQWCVGPRRVRHSKPSICGAKRGEAIGDLPALLCAKPFGGAVGLVSALEHVACPRREPRLVFRVLPVIPWK